MSTPVWGAGANNWVSNASPSPGQDSPRTPSSNRSAAVDLCFKANVGKQVDAPRTISIPEDRSQPGASPESPGFLRQFAGLDSTIQNWVTIVLPYVVECVFQLETVVDVNYLHEIANSPKFPNMRYAITRLHFPKFHWFSGIQHNRNVNPNLAFCATLPNVHEVLITLHTAGLTSSMWTERERIRLEQEGEFEKSKYLRVRRLDDILRFYDFDTLLECQSLRIVHLECIDSDLVQTHTRAGDPLSPFHDLARWIQQGFHQRHGINVIVYKRLLQ